RRRPHGNLQNRRRSLPVLRHGNGFPVGRGIRARFHPRNLHQHRPVLRLGPQTGHAVTPDVRREGPHPQRNGLFLHRVTTVVRLVSTTSTGRGHQPRRNNHHRRGAAAVRVSAPHRLRSSRRHMSRLRSTGRSATSHTAGRHPAPTAGNRRRTA